MTAYTDFHYSPTGSGVISGAQVLEQTEQGINGLGHYVQDNVSGAIDTANQALTTAQSADSNATTAINLANSFNAQIIAANQTAGNALTTAQSAQNTANSASSLATTANNNAATALNTANAASAGVTTLTGTVNSLGNRMTAAENAINANAGNITTLQNNLATTNANVTAAANAASSAQATATSAQSTATLARNQAYVLRYTGTTITGGGTIAYADIDNTDNIKAGDKIIDVTGAIYAIASVDTANQTVTVGASPVINLFCDAENLIPAANDAYDLGSASKQWLNTYSKGYYYNGVAWGLDKANEWSANNTFTTNVTIGKNSASPTASSDTSLALTGNSSYIFFRTKGSSNYRSYNSFLWGGYTTDASPYRYGRLRVYRASAIYGETGEETPDTSFSFIDVALHYKWVSLTDNVRFINDGTTDACYPVANNATDLGTSTNKWKTLNGINPGALSLPNNTASVTIDTTSWDKRVTNGLIGGFTATEDGWLNIQVQRDVDFAVWVISSYRQLFRAGLQGNGTYLVMVFLPVTKGSTFNLYTLPLDTNESDLSFGVYRFYPCLGNV